MLARGDGILTAATKQKARDAMHLVEDILRNVTDINGAGREQINSREVYSFNASMQAEKSDMICQNKWTNIETMEDIIIGDEVSILVFALYGLSKRYFANLHCFYHARCI